MATASSTTTGFGAGADCRLSETEYVSLRSTHASATKHPLKPAKTESSHLFVNKCMNCAWNMAIGPNAIDNGNAA